MKKIAIVFFFIIGCTSISYGQNSNSTEQEPFVIVEQMPEFPGGDSALMAYIRINTKYPPKALYNEKRGSVIVKFIVNTDGTISNAKVTKRIGNGFDEEAIRVINNMPKWKPGKQGGKYVPVLLDIPFDFTID